MQRCTPGSLPPARFRLRPVPLCVHRIIRPILGRPFVAGDQAVVYAERNASRGARWELQRADSDLEIEKSSAGK